MKQAIITGGGGFIGAYLVKRLVHDGWRVSVVDTLIRGDASRFAEVADVVELITADVRDEDALKKAFQGIDVVFHLAAINGTENFYKRPELVLDVGIRGAIAVVNACRSAGVKDLVVASSAEVYQTPSILPTPESIPLMIPDSLNPRYSYGGSKLASELIAFNYAQDFFEKVQVFRPHNVYGSNMGWKHVIPQFLMRALQASKTYKKTPIPFQIQGDGTETRAFCYVDDIVDGILTMYAQGKHREVYHIGNDEEVSINNLVQQVATALKVELNVSHSALQQGGTSRRCPDISKMRGLGYAPKVNLVQGLENTAQWYQAHQEKQPDNELM